MTVADLISILQQQDQTAIVVQLDMQSTKRHQILKLGRGDVRPVFVAVEEKHGDTYIKLARQNSTAAVPGFLLGEVL